MATVTRTVMAQRKSPTPKQKPPSSATKPRPTIEVFTDSPGQNRGCCFCGSRPLPKQFPRAGVLLNRRFHNDRNPELGLLGGSVAGGKHSRGNCRSCRTHALRGRGTRHFFQLRYERPRFADVAITKLRRGLGSARRIAYKMPPGPPCGVLLVRPPHS